MSTSFFMWSLFDKLDLVHFYQNQFSHKETLTSYGEMFYLLLLISFLVYCAMQTYFICKILQRKRQIDAGRMHSDLVFLLVGLSVFLVVLMTYPFANHTLRYMCQNGTVNLYIFIMTFLMEAFTEEDFRYESDTTTGRTTEFASQEHEMSKFEIDRQIEVRTPSEE